MKLLVFLISLSLSGLLADDLQNDLEVIFERRLLELVTDNHDIRLASQWYVISISAVEHGFQYKKVPKLGVEQGVFCFPVLCLCFV